MLVHNSIVLVWFISTRLTRHMFTNNFSSSYALLKLNKTWSRPASLTVMQQTKVSLRSHIKVVMKYAHWAAFDVTIQKREWSEILMRKYLRELRWKAGRLMIRPNGEAQKLDMTEFKGAECFEASIKSIFRIFHHEAQLVCPLCRSCRQGRTCELCDIKIDIVTNGRRAVFVFI